MTTLARFDRPEHDDLEGLRARLTEVEALCGERAAHVARVTSDLDAFRIRYRQRVGTLHDRLDELDLAIAEAELGELSKRLGDEATRPSASPPDAGPAPPRYTSDAVRALFRDVAKAIHPDLARDEGARDRRHSLMIEANRAYALGDEEQLRCILQAWERSPEAVPGSHPEATRLRLVRRIAQVEEQLDRLGVDLHELQASPLGQLKAMVDAAAARGKDLIAEMVVRLERDIMVATNRLDAMQPRR